MLSSSVVAGDLQKKSVGFFLPQNHVLFSPSSYSAVASPVHLTARETLLSHM